MSRPDEADRVFATWTWKDQAVYPWHGLKFDVRYRHGRTIQEDAPTFYIDTEKQSHESPIRVQIEDGSLTELRKKLDEMIRGALTIKWTPVLVVKVNNHEGGWQFDKGRVIEFGWRERERGSLLGKLVERVPAESSDGNTEVRVNWYDPQRERDEAQEKNTTLAVLDDTPENRAALASIALGFDTLTERLHNLINIAKDTRALPPEASRF